MPRKAHLAKHHSSEELKKKYLKSKDSVESRRWHLLWKISLGWLSCTGGDKSQETSILS